MSDRSLDIAVIGAGQMGREHVARLLANPRCRVAAIVDPDAQAAEWARGLQIRHHAGVDAMLSQHQPDGAIVATPNDLHVSTAVVLLDAGVPVIVEKPVAESVSAGEVLVRKSLETGVPVLVGHHRRHSPAMLAAQACIAQGTLGPIVAVNATTLFYKPKAYFDVAWRRGPAGGPILINLVHDIDSLRALAGEIAAVQAVASNHTRGFQAEDTAGVLLEFSSGALGTLLLSDTTVAARSWEHTTGENPAYPCDPAQDCIFIAGTRGSLAVPTLRLWRQEGEASWTLPFLSETMELKEADPLARQLDHFCDVVEQGVAPLVSAADAVRTLAVTLAVREAARTRTRIEVPPS
ncbi:MAG: Gfo/Idh/MocA family protein [Bryobacteraceae bacterium]